MTRKHEYGFIQWRAAFILFITNGDALTSEQYPNMLNSVTSDMDI